MPPAGKLSNRGCKSWLTVEGGITLMIAKYYLLFRACCLTYFSMPRIPECACGVFVYQISVISFYAGLLQAFSNDSYKSLAAMMLPDQFLYPQKHIIRLRFLRIPTKYSGIRGFFPLSPKSKGHLQLFSSLYLNRASSVMPFHVSVRKGAAGNPSLLNRLASILSSAQP